MKLTVWMEPRCDQVLQGLAEGEDACQQTGSGGFFGSFRDAVLAFKANGWTVRRGEWICPACRRGEAKKKAR